MTAKAPFAAHELNTLTQLHRALIGQARSPARRRHDLLCIDQLRAMQRTRSLSSEHMDVIGTVHTKREVANCSWVQFMCCERGSTGRQSVALIQKSAQCHYRRAPELSLTAPKLIFTNSLSLFTLICKYAVSKCDNTSSTCSNHFDNLVTSSEQDNWKTL